MFLKSIEIRGFKSFADKTELVLKKGITIIVGPNGSGKSNILDAVKWVLGEQSVKSLRGGKMEDVIFAGTEFRKSVGLAQVTLTLDNNDNELPIDYTDVTITRRLFRSGESEYYINNNKCRLKDIQELFMDTGIGKEGYSIIGQGKIDAILSGKPEERRSLLEEAAGIVKFKTRKEETEKKLQITEQNIQRINDIFYTYEDRLEPLKVENEKAHLFIDLSKKLKVKEATLILNNIEKIEEKISILKGKIKDNNFKLKELIERKDKYKLQVNNLNKKLEEIEKKNENERKQYYENKSKREKLISEINIFNERIENLSNAINKASKNLMQLKEKFENSNLQRNRYQCELDKLLEEQKELESSILNIEKLVEDKFKIIEKNKKLIDDGKTCQVDLISKITQNKNDLRVLEDNISILQNKISDLEEAKGVFRNSININNRNKDLLQNNIISIDEKIKEYEDKIKNYKKNISNINKDLIDKEGILKKFYDAYNKMEANRNALISLDKHHEGFNKSSKILMQHIDNGIIKDIKGKACILGEVLKVPKDYETAIEIALGSALSNIITDNEITAKELITYLKDNNLGRATFLPLSIIKGKKISVLSKIKNIDGYVGIASELVDFDREHIDAINYILGRTIIAKDMDSALHIAKEIRYSYKIVTLLGEVVNPGGALTGGSLYNRNFNVIGRGRKIQELKDQLKIYNKNIEDLREFINKQKASIKSLDDACLDLKDEIYYQNIEKTKINSKINSLIDRTEKLKEDVKTSDNEILIIKEDIIKKTKESQLKIEELNSLNKLSEDNLANISKLEITLDKVDKEVKSKRDYITSLRIRKAQLDEIILNKKRELQRLGMEVESSTLDMDSLKSEISESNKQIKSAKDGIGKNYKYIEEINNIIIKFEENFKDIEIKRIKIKEDIKKITDKLEDTVLLCNKNEKFKNSIEISLARYETEKSVQYRKLNEGLDLTYAEALEIKIHNIDLNECKKDIDIYKDKISKLGVVNLGAIKEYEELLEKYTFMKNQKEDLIKAKEELLSVVLEMTEKMKKVFKENFIKLRENFNETFKELFKGGSADLMLKDGDELSGNIEINVQLPGKKLQNLNLMSGGEKGLSAIALLFAILKMKPTPFCILDEIESALDDSNVIRYSEFLKKFSNNTQFIIITHRKGTMEVGDVLYGVTMEEKGVSKIISVDLTEK